MQLKYCGFAGLAWKSPALRAGAKPPTPPFAAKRKFYYAKCYGGEGFNVLCFVHYCPRRTVGKGDHF